MKKVLFVLAALTVSACSKDEGKNTQSATDSGSAVDVAEDVTATAADVTAVDAPVSTTPVVSEPVDATSVGG
mgnify:CR=1 FL=1